MSGSEARGLNPVSLAALEDVRSARVLRLALQECADHNPVAADGDRVSEPHPWRRIARHQLRRLAPPVAASFEHIRSACALAVAAVIWCAGHDRVATGSDGKAEHLPRGAVIGR